MKYFAREAAGKVAEIIKVKAGDDIADLYHPDFVATLVEVSSSVKEGWVRDGGGFVAPGPVETTKEQLAAYAATCRRRSEIGGMSFGGKAVATDAESQTKVLGARVAANADPAFTTPWFGDDGVPVLLDATAIVALSDAMLAHVQGGFVTRAALLDQIAAGTVTTFAEIDAAFA